MVLVLKYIFRVLTSSLLLYVRNVTVTSCHVYVGVSAMEIKTKPDDVIEYLSAHHGISAELQPAAHHLS